MKSWIRVVFGAVIMVICLAMAGCTEMQTSSDEKATAQQEQIQQSVDSQVGMPNVKNAREKKLLKMIIEMRDQADLVTYTYLENQMPKVVPGHTCLGGKVTYFGQSVGFGIPYATQFTNPQKVEHLYGPAYVAIPQADPNGLFSPSSASGTWIMMSDDKGEVHPQYIEPSIMVLTYKLPFDE